MAKSLRHAHLSWLLGIVIIGLALFALQLAHYPADAGTDWYWTFGPAVASWLRGEPVPVNGFANAPWTLFLLLPFYLLAPYSEIAIATFSLFSLFGAWRIFSHPVTPRVRLLTLILVFLNMHLLDLWYRAQVDAFLMWCVVCLYLGLKRRNPYLIGIAWVLAGVRPTSVYLLLIYALWFCWRERLLVRALLIPIAVFLLSLVIFDPGWIGRWLINGRTLPGPWFSTLWRVAEYYSLSPWVATFVAAGIIGVTFCLLWRRKLRLEQRFALLAAASLLTAPYALPYHYNVLLVVVVPVVLGWRWWFFIPLLFLGWSPLTRLTWLPLEMTWIDHSLPLTLWLLLAWQLGKQKGDPIQDRPLVLHIADVQLRVPTTNSQ